MSPYAQRDRAGRATRGHQGLRGSPPATAESHQCHRINRHFFCSHVDHTFDCAAAMLGPRRRATSPCPRAPCSVVIRSQRLEPATLSVCCAEADGLAEGRASARSGRKPARLLHPASTERIRGGAAQTLGPARQALGAAPSQHQARGAGLEPDESIRRLLACRAAARRAHDGARCVHRSGRSQKRSVGPRPERT